MLKMKDLSNKNGEHLKPTNHSGDDIMYIYIYIYHGDESCGYDGTMVRLTQNHQTLGLNMT